MKIAVINAGSSSLKLSLFENTKELVRCTVERIGLLESFFQSDGLLIKKQIKNHKEALKIIIEYILAKEIVSSLNEINLVGHRVVHGGEIYSKPAIITKKVISDIKKLFPLAPIHNPINLKCIILSKKMLPKAVHIAVFDTAFHSSMSQKVFLYPLPYQLYKKNKIRKYGFHGTSHKYVAEKAAEILKKDIKKLKIITCHLGNGVSITAVKNGVSVDTSMGFTPLDGLMMGTRSGSIDPEIVLYLEKNLGYSVQKTIELLNYESGLKGVSEKSSDMLDLINSNDSLAKLAIEMFVYRIQKFIGSYAAALDGVDTIVFTAGIGERSSLIRKKVCDSLSFLGVKIDDKLNGDNAKIISSKNSKVKVLVVPTDEELEIAKEALLVYKR